MGAFKPGYSTWMHLRRYSFAYRGCGDFSILCAFCKSFYLQIHKGKRDMGHHGGGDEDLCTYTVYSCRIDRVFTRAHTHAGATDSQRMDTCTFYKRDSTSYCYKCVPAYRGNGYGHHTGYPYIKSDSASNRAEHRHEPYPFRSSDDRKPCNRICDTAYRSKFVCGKLTDGCAGYADSKEGGAYDRIFPAGTADTYICTGD